MEICPLFFEYFYKFHHSQDAQKAAKNHFQNFGWQERHQNCARHRKDNSKQNYPKNVFGHDVTVSIVNVNGKDCHNQKTHQIYALRKLLVKAQKDGQNWNKKCSAAHAKTAENARNKPRQDIEKINHRLILRL